MPCKDLFEGLCAPLALKFCQHLMHSSVVSLIAHLCMYTSSGCIERWACSTPHLFVPVLILHSHCSFAMQRRIAARVPRRAAPRSGHAA